jgi:Cof subfamily protein (haloacid dehalogenase superfamily)
VSGRLLFLDIDGTLAPAGSNDPPESALVAIGKARANGHRVFLCTGRSRDMLAPLLRFGLFDGAVASDGGYVFCGDRVLYDCPMSDKQRETAMERFAAGGVFRTLEALDGSFCDDGMAEFLNEVSGGNSELVRWRKALEADLGMRPMAEYDGRPIYKVVFMCRSAEQLAPAIEALEKDFFFVVQDMNGADCLNGEIVNRKFDKGKGILRVCERLGCDVADTVGFGDSMNDLEMIETVGISVCMANGSPQLKKRSQIVCPAVDEDGLAQAFRDLALVNSTKNDV